MSSEVAVVVEDAVKTSGTLTLWYGSAQIGYIKDAFLHQGTWFGAFERVANPNNDQLVQRVADFIQFCEEWNDRVEISNKTSGPLPAVEEFDQYEDVIKSGSWAVTNSQGDVRRIDEAPVFFKGGEVTWSLSKKPLQTAIH